MFQFFICFGFPFGMMPNSFFIIIIIEKKQGNYESSEKKRVSSSIKTTTQLVAISELNWPNSIKIMKKETIE